MLELKNISIQLGDFTLDDICLSIRDKEYFVILGISGAGKSVLLEMVAGLVTPDTGSVLLNGSDITNSKIHDRDVGIVFQDYAVFPHMTVLENICYPIRNTGVKKKQAKEIGKQYAIEMGIGHLLNRMPPTLSGGELQRVALARTLALKPSFLLLDEPLASNDVQLQDELRALLRNINRKGITIIHVTHNYEEALSLAERIAVIYKGKVLETGTPKEVFHTPKSEFIANFTGIRNFFNATYIEENLSLAEGKVAIKHFNNSKEKMGYLMLRSEDVIVSTENNPSSALNNFEGKVIDFFPCTFGIELLVDINIEVTAHITQDSFEKLNLSIGKMVWISFKATAVKFISHDQL